MINVKIMLAATALMTAFASPAFTQEGSTLVERNVYLYQDGQMLRIPADDRIHAMVMREFKPMRKGTMTRRSGGKTYISEDGRTASGQLLQQEIYGREEFVN